MEAIYISCSIEGTKREENINKARQTSTTSDEESH